MNRIAPRRHLLAYCSALTLLMINWACGVKGPPRPPERLMPERIRDLTLHVKGRDVILEWSIPQRTTSGAPLKDLEGFRIMRARQGKCPACPARFETVAKIGYKFPTGTHLPGGKMAFWDRDLKPGTYIYTVRAYNKRGYESEESNPASIDLPVPASAPRGLRAIAGDGNVQLLWDPVATFEDGNLITHLSGYNIYRGEEQQRYGFFPINTEPVQETSFLDLHVRNNRKYFYAVRAVRMVNGKAMEGNISNEVQAIPMDMTPPDPPEGLACQVTEKGILLTWRENREPDLRGYNVYRRMEGSKEFVKLTPRPIEETRFLDGDVRIKTWYVYAVTALDNAPGANESRLSMECFIQYRE